MGLISELKKTANTAKKKITQKSQSSSKKSSSSSSKKSTSTSKKKNTLKTGTNKLKKGGIKVLDDAIEENEKAQKKKSSTKNSKNKKLVNKITSKINSLESEKSELEEKIKKSGLSSQMSVADKALAEQDPEAGNKILEAKKEYAAATTKEQKEKAHQKAEDVRRRAGSYSGGTTGADYSITKPNFGELVKKPDNYDNAIEKNEEKQAKIQSKINALGDKAQSNPSSLRGAAGLVNVLDEAETKSLKKEKAKLEAQNTALKQSKWDSEDKKYQELTKNKDFDTVVKNANPSEKNKSAAGYLNMMDSSEKKIYKYILETEGNEAGYEYIKHITSSENNSKRMSTYLRQVKNEAKQNPVKASIASIAEAPLAAVSTVGLAADYFADGKIDTDAWYNRFSKTSSAQREAVSKVVEDKWGKTGSFLYGVGMSMGDFLTAAGVSPAGATYILSGEVAPEMIYSAKKRGLSDDNAMALGLVAGTACAVVERLGMDAFLDRGLFKTASSRMLSQFGLKSTVGDKLKKTGVAALAEGTEEGVEDVINLTADIVCSGNQSEIVQRHNQLVANGYSSKEAWKQVAVEQVQEIGLDMLAGGIAGGTMKGSSYGVQSLGKALGNWSAKTQEKERQKNVEKINSLIDSKLKETEGKASEANKQTGGNNQTQAQTSNQKSETSNQKSETSSRKTEASNQKSKGVDAQPEQTAEAEYLSRVEQERAKTEESERRYTETGSNSDVEAQGEDETEVKAQSEETSGAEPVSSQAQSQKPAEVSASSATQTQTSNQKAQTSNSKAQSSASAQVNSSQTEQTAEAKYLSRAEQERIKTEESEKNYFSSQAQADTNTESEVSVNNIKPQQLTSNNTNQQQTSSNEAQAETSESTRQPRALDYLIEINQADENRRGEALSQIVSLAEYEGDTKTKEAAEKMLTEYNDSGYINLQTLLDDGELTDNQRSVVEEYVNNDRTYNVDEAVNKLNSDVKSGKISDEQSYEEYNDILANEGEQGIDMLSKQFSLKENTGSIYDDFNASEPNTYTLNSSNRTTGSSFGSTSSNVTNNTSGSASRQFDAAKMSKVLGRKIEFYTAEDESNGYKDEEGTIHINTTNIGGDLFVLGHELTHIIEGTNSYRVLDAVAEEAYGKEAFDQMVADKIQRYAKAGVRLSDEEARQEIVADFCSDYILQHDEAAIYNLVAKDRSLALRIAEWIDSILARHGDLDAQDRQYLNTLRQIYSDALGEVQNYKSESSNQNAGKFSLKDGASEANIEAYLYNKYPYASREELRNAVIGIKETLSVQEPLLLSDRKSGFQKPNTPQGGNASGRSGSLQRGKIIARGVVENFVQRGYVDFAGKKLSNDPEQAKKQLATYAQILRNPHFETFRIFYVKGDEIVGAEAVSSNLVEGSHFTTEKSLDAFVYKMKYRMKRLGADGYYLLHNHPSGNSYPSDADAEVTVFIGKNVPGFKSHVVIDHNNYSSLDIQGTKLVFSPNYSVYSPENFRQRVVDHPLLYKKLNNTTETANASIGLVHSEDYFVVVYTNVKNEILGIEEYANGFAESDGFNGFVANRKIEYGCPNAFLISANYDLFSSYHVLSSYEKNLFLDVIFVGGVSSGNPYYSDDYLENHVDRETDARGNNKYNKYGKPVDSEKGRRVTEPSAEFNPNRFSLKEPVETTDKFIAWHNMNEDALRESLELGGLAMPSFALLTSGKEYGWFGDYSVLASRDDIEPRRKKDRSIYSADAFTPVVPRYALVNINNSSKKGISKKGQHYSSSDLLTVESDPSKFDDYFYDFTLDNLVKVMRSQLPYANYDYITAAGAKRFKSIKEAKREAYRFGEMEEYHAAVDKAEHELSDLINKLHAKDFEGNKFPPGRRSYEDALFEIFYNSNSASEAVKYAKKNYYKKRQYLKLTLSDIESIGELYETLNSVPTYFFEAKIYDAFPVEKWSVVIAPSNGDENIKEQLRSAGIDVVEYENGNEADRVAKANEYADTHPEKKVRFSLKSESNDVRYSLKEVAPVIPTSTDWSRSSTFFQVKFKHPTLFELDADEAEKRNPTQTTSTIKTYEKIYRHLADEGFDGTILDASSGLGLGTQVGRENFGYDVDDIEPFPDNSYNPRYTDYSSFDKKYDVVISNAVLNVLPQDIRDSMVVKISEMLNPGGRAFINVRGSDVKNAKSKIEIDANNLEYFIEKDGSYQKGFSLKELTAYLEDALGDNFTVEPAKWFGKVSVVVTKNSEYQEEFQVSDKTYADAIGRGDIKAAQFMVDYVAKQNGYTKKSYHGTNERFVVFNRDENYMHPGIYLSSDKDVASTYGQNVQSLYLKIKNPLVVDAKGNSFFNIRTNAVNVFSYEKTSVDELAYDAYYRGNDGLIVSNVRDVGAETRGGTTLPDGHSGLGTDYVVFNPEQIKSSDPVTYDDDGNIIPLSKRFNPESNDVRYSLKESDRKKEFVSFSDLPKTRQEQVRKYSRALANDAISLFSVEDKQEAKDLMYKLQDEWFSNDGVVNDDVIDDYADQLIDLGVVHEGKYDFGLEESDAKFIKSYLRNTPMYVQEEYKQDITDYNDLRKRLFGRVNLVKGKNYGEFGRYTAHPVESVYGSLRNDYPGIFPEMVHESEMLFKIEEILDDMKGDDIKLRDSRVWNDSYEQFFKSEFRNAARDTFAKWNSIERYGVEQANKPSAAELREAAANMSSGEAMMRYEDLKRARFQVERARSNYALTEDDINLANLVFHNIVSQDDIDPNLYNKEGIERYVEAKRNYEDKVMYIKRYNIALKEKKDTANEDLIASVESYRDHSMGIFYERETPERVFEYVFGKKDGQSFIKHIMRPLHKAVADANTYKNEMRERVEALDLSRKVKSGNTMSEAYIVQALGEARSNIRIMEKSRGLMSWREGKTLAEWRAFESSIYAENPGIDFDKIRHAISEFQSIYDELFKRMNETRVKNGYEPVNYHQGYFPHFQSEGNGLFARFARAVGIDLDVQSLPTQINGLTHMFKPGITYFAHVNERLGFNTDYDAVEGFDSYIEGVADVIFMTDSIQTLRSLSRVVRYRASDEGIKKQVDEIRNRMDISETEKDALIQDKLSGGRYELSTFASWLDEYTNLLANKKSKADRAIEDKVGRRIYTIMKNFESRVAANMIVPNIRSAFTNIIPVIQASPVLGTKNTVIGMYETLRNIASPDGLHEASDFLSTRQGSQPLIKTKVEKITDIFAMPMIWMDEFSTGTIVRARYHQNISRGISETEALADADDFARRVVGGRTKGAMPTLFLEKNPLTKFMTQFQLEVNNQLSFLFKDLPEEAKKKGLGVIALYILKYMMASWLFNELFEYLMGTRPALDPIGMANDTVGDLVGYKLPNVINMAEALAKGEEINFETEKAETGWEAFKGAVDRTSDQLPVIGGVVKGLFSDSENARYPVASAIPTIENLDDIFNADNSTTRNAAIKKTAMKGLYVIPPFGGGQIKKLAETFFGFLEGGSYSVTNSGEYKLQYPMGEKGSLLGNVGQFAYSSIFGKTALPTAREWINGGFQSYDENLTSAYRGMINDGLTANKAFDTIEKVNSYEIDDDLTSSEKKKAYAQYISTLDVDDISKMRLYQGFSATKQESEAIDECINEGCSKEALAKVVAGIYAETADVEGTDTKAYAAKVIDDSDLLNTQKLALRKGFVVSDYDDIVEKYTDGGLSEEDAIKVADSISLGLYAGGKMSTSDVDKYMAVVDSGLTGDTLAKALYTAFGSTGTYVTKTKVAYEQFGLSPEYFARALSLKSKYCEDGGVYTKETAKQAVDEIGAEYGLTTEQMATLYSTLNTAEYWSKSNPYSSSQGMKVWSAIQDALGKSTDDAEAQSVEEYTVEGFNGTKNFSLEEIRCTDGSLPDFNQDMVDHASRIQAIRDYLGYELTINSWYRSPSYNATVSGAAKDSYHTKGIATDIAYPSGLSSSERQAWVSDIKSKWRELNDGKGGVGVYSWGVHLDSRTYKSDWIGN